jgi:hypothetical protein
VALSGGDRSLQGRRHDAASIRLDAMRGCDAPTIFNTVPTPQPTSRAIFLMPYPSARSASTFALVASETGGLPIGLPDLVPFSD